MAEELAFEHLARHGGAVEGDEGLVGAVGVVVDRAGQDFLAGAAFAGDEDADVGRGDALGERHQLAHAAAHDRLPVLERRVVDRPQRQALFALGPRALDFVDGGEQERDGVDRGDRFDVVTRIQPDLHGSIADRADGQPSRPGDRRVLRLAGVADGREDLALTVLAGEEGDGPAGAAGLREHVDQLVGQELGPIGLEHESGDGLEHVAGAERAGVRRVRGRGWGSGRVRRARGPDGGVPASRQLQESRRVPQAGVEAFRALSMRAGDVGLARRGQGAGQDHFVLCVEIGGLVDKRGQKRSEQGERLRHSAVLLKE